jgi:chromate reductase, NAD(P)H dehydrogenase (quinone)
MATYKVGYFVGSLSSTSINRALSTALIGLAPDDLSFAEIPINKLPLYSADFDENYPRRRPLSRRRSPPPMPCCS